MYCSVYSRVAASFTWKMVQKSRFTQEHKDYFFCIRFIAIYLDNKICLYVVILINGSRYILQLLVCESIFSILRTVS